MTNQRLEEISEVLAKDEPFLREIFSKTISEISEWFKTHDFEVSSEETEEYLSKMKSFAEAQESGELTEEDAELVAGGGIGLGILWRAVTTIVKRSSGGGGNGAFGGGGGIGGR